MTKTETVIRSIFGAAGIDTRPLARAVDIAAELLFTHRQTIDELHFTRDIYSPVAVLLRGKNGEPQSVKTISKSIERLSNQCWDILVARGLVGKYIGAEPRTQGYHHLSGLLQPSRRPLLHRHGTGVRPARVKWEPQREGGGAAPPSGRLSQYRGFRTGGAEMGAVPLHFHNLY